jgi:hypothetical protein
VRFEAEQLEARTLLSRGMRAYGLPPFLRDLPPHTFTVVHGIVVPSPSAIQAPTESLAVQTPSPFVTRQAGVLDVTVVRKGLDGPHATPKATALSEPLTVNVSATIGSTRHVLQVASSPAFASDASTPNSESVAFPAGVTTETVRIPINPGTAISGTVPVWISATATSGFVVPTQQAVYLLSGPDAVPPMITSAQLITQGRHASGIAITFSKPMAPATVENVHNYSVSTLQKGNTILNPLALVAPPGYFMSIRYSALKAARYDPSTQTVTLLPRQPFSASNVYNVQSPPRLAGHVITDVEGNPLYDSDSGPMNGHFQILVTRRPSAT